MSGSGEVISFEVVSPGVVSVELFIGIALVGNVEGIIVVVVVVMEMLVLPVMA